MEPGGWPLPDAADVADRLQPWPRSRAAADLGAAITAGRPLTLVLDGAAPVERPDVVVVLEHPAPAPSAVHRAAAYVDSGLPVCCQVGWGDRNRVAVEGDLAALADLGAAGVVVDVRPPVPHLVQDLSAADVVRLARYAGHLVAVAGTGADAAPWAALGAEVALVGAGRVHGLPSVAVPGLA